MCWSLKRPLITGTSLYAPFTLPFWALWLTLEYIKVKCQNQNAFCVCHQRLFWSPRGLRAVPRCELVRPVIAWLVAQLTICDTRDLKSRGSWVDHCKSERDIHPIPESSFVPLCSCIVATFGHLVFKCGLTCSGAWLYHFKFCSVDAHPQAFYR